MQILDEPVINYHTRRAQNYSIIFSGSRVFLVFFFSRHKQATQKHHTPQPFLGIGHPHGSKFNDP